MKKGLIFLLTATLIGASLAGCGGKTNNNETESEATEEVETYEQAPNQAVVNNPYKEAPSYVLAEGASTDEMREMAIQAMHDELSVKWTPTQHFEYNKSGSVSEKDYIFEPTVVYAGLPYTTSASGLFQWLEYYDYTNGNFHDAPFGRIEGSLGNSCSASCSWGLAAVCPSLGNADSTFRFTKRSNMFPLGEVDYADTITNFKDYTTRQICTDNGQQKVLEGYALLKKADIVIAAGDGTDAHGMMAIEDATVVRKADGTINMEESYVMMQDQRANEKIYDEDDQKVSYRGRVEAKILFTELWNGAYIALTPKEFRDNATYVPATCTCDKEATDLKSLTGLYIDSNYRLAVIKMAITDENGKAIYKITDTTGNPEIQDNTVHRYSLRALFNPSVAKRDLVSGQKYKVTITTVVATGQEFTPIEFEFTAE